MQASLFGFAARFFAIPDQTLNTIVISPIDNAVKIDDKSEPFWEARASFSASQPDIEAEHLAFLFQHLNESEPFS